MKQKPRTAVALSYHETEDGAPKVSASGTEELARLITQLARRYGVPIEERPDVVDKLAQLEVEEEIPAELYLDVAKILKRSDS